MKRTLTSVGTFVSSLCLSLPALGGGLTTPFSLDSANVMPSGVRNVRLGGFTTEVSDKYGDDGMVVPMANSFNKPVTWKELMSAVPAGVDRGVLKGGLQGSGISMNDVAGNSEGILNARISVTTPVLAYGLNERWTIGMGVPIIYSNVAVSAGWQANADFQKTLNKLSANGQYAKIKGFESKLANVVATKIATYGYQPLEDQKKTEMGDVTLGAKFQFYKDKDLTAAIAPKIVLPTGRTSDVNKVVDIAAGDGQWDLGLGAVADYYVASRLIVTSSATYTFQSAQKKAKRIPLSGDESISPDIDSDTIEKLGDTMGAGLAAKYKLYELWTLGAGYSFQYKNADSYTGTKYSSDRYAYMSKETEQTMHSGQVGVTFSTIPLFQAKKFAAPLEATLTYSSVLSGRNVSNVGLAAFELAAYF